jgi:hypothetical protein
LYPSACPPGQSPSGCIRRDSIHVVDWTSPPGRSPPPGQSPGGPLLRFADGWIKVEPRSGAVRL